MKIEVARVVTIRTTVSPDSYPGMTVEEIIQRESGLGIEDVSGLLEFAETTMYTTVQVSE